MVKHTLFLLLLMFSFFLGSCSEKEKKMETSTDMLFSIRGSIPILELEDESVRNEIESEMMSELLSFINERGVMEMKRKERRYDVYKNLSKFKKGSKLVDGEYLFATDAMKVTLSLDGKEQTFVIGGPLGKTFYNHFVRPTGANDPHIVEDAGVFCLYTEHSEYFKAKYPDAGIAVAEIRTDMVNLRRLSTYK